MAAEARAAVHVHHGAARCLLALFDATAEGLAPWADFDAEAERWGVDPRLSREDLDAVVEGSARASRRRSPAAAPGRRRLRAVGPAWGLAHTRPLRPAVLRPPGLPALGP